jgi:hypothetical protein
MQLPRRKAAPAYKNNGAKVSAHRSCLGKKPHLRPHLRKDMNALKIELGNK